METANIKKKIHLVLVALIFYIQKGTGFSTSPSPHTSCASSTANISYIFSTDASESIIGNRIWFFGTSKIAESDGTTLTPVQSYSSRLTAYGTSGISLSNIAIADAGTYTYVIVLLPSGSPFTATASLSVQVAPLAPPSGCQVSSNQPSSIPTCTVDTVSGKCGTPSLNAFLVNSTNTSSQFMCNVGETYQCCATGAALACYSGSPNDFCKLFICTAAQTTTPKKPKCELELGLGLGLGLGIPCVITAIDIGIFIYIGYEYPYYLGLVIGLGVGFTFEVGWIIIASLLSTGNECKLELGLGLGLGSGIPDVIAYVVSVIFVFFVVTIFINIPNRVELGKGILTGLLIASVLGIILVILLYDKLKRKQTCTTHKDNPQEADGKKTEQVPLEPNVKNSQTNNSGTPASQTRTKKKVELDAISNQTNDRQQSMAPIRQQPVPPQNGEIKDRSLRGISATLEDTPGLASETPRPNRLLPLPPKQETIQNEDASEEPKKKRKKKKKKDQIKEETPEEENGKTNLRVN